MKTIYLIINTLNNKKYIGQTSKSIYERWKVHIYESKRDKCKNRDLYIDINTYGEHVFNIYEITKCKDEDANNLEMYYINLYNTFLNGYNNTYGGKGKYYIDYRRVCDLYSIYKNCGIVANIMNISVDSVSYILRLNNINIIQSYQILKNKYSKAINIVDNNDKIIKSFYSISDASRYLKTYFNKNKTNSHIRECANGDRNTAYGFKWKFDTDIIKEGNKINPFKSVLL